MYFGVVTYCFWSENYNNKLPKSSRLYFLSLYLKVSCTCLYFVFTLWEINFALAQQYTYYNNMYSTYQSTYIIIINIICWVWTFSLQSVMKSSRCHVIVYIIIPWIVTFYCNIMYLNPPPILAGDILKKHLLDSHCKHHLYFTMNFLRVWQVTCSLFCAKLL